MMGSCSRTTSDFLNNMIGYKNSELDSLEKLLGKQDNLFKRKQIVLKIERIRKIASDVAVKFVREIGKVGDYAHFVFTRREEYRLPFKV